MSVEKLAELLRHAERTVFFTGAGVSTESGIPDFRSPGGVWSRYDPRELTFDRYVELAEVRALSWQMRREFFAAGAKPNPAHRVIADLELGGRSLGVVTQNIDGLHQAAGSQTVVELHGTAREVTCIGIAPAGGTPAGCGWRADTSWAFDALDAGEEDPRCPECGGIVKSATISFGQMLDDAALRRAKRLILAADALVVVGTSLQVYPAAGLPALARSRGVPIAIVNREPTDLDDEVDVVVLGTAGEILASTVTSE